MHPPISSSGTRDAAPPHARPRQCALPLALLMMLSLASCLRLGSESFRRPLVCRAPQRGARRCGRPAPGLGQGLGSRHGRNLTRTVTAWPELDSDLRRARRAALPWHFPRPCVPGGLGPRLRPRRARCTGRRDCRGRLGWASRHEQAREPVSAHSRDATPRAHAVAAAAWLQAGGARARMGAMRVYCICMYVCMYIIIYRVEVAVAKVMHVRQAGCNLPATAGWWRALGASRDCLD